MTSRRPVGTNVFDRDWDILILLDTCRVDAIDYVHQEYNFLNKSNIDDITSVGSTSAEWMANTFIPKYDDKISSTAYLTNNSYSKRVLEENKYPLDDHFFGSVWTDWETVNQHTLQYLEYTWQCLPSHEYHRYHPRGIFDRAIQVWEGKCPNRMIIHSIQPHSPYVSDLILNKSNFSS